MNSKSSGKKYPNTVNYTLIGICFGFLFPIVATIFDINLQGLELSFQSALEVQAGNPLHWIIDTAPFFLGSLSALAGFRKDQTVHINQGLEETVQERTKSLEEKNNELEQEIAQRIQTEKELFEAKEAAEAGARAKTQFLSTMSHEIRTPLNAVIGITGLLRDTNLNDEQRDFVKTIYKSGDNLLGIINNILDYAKIESGKFDLEEVEFSVAYLVEDVLDLVSATDIGKKIELLYDIEDHVPDYVFGDSTRIQQVLVNLTRNALKFTEEGEVLITIDLEEETGDDALSLRFKVKDTGIGIEHSKQEKLFKSFSQIDASTTRKFGGTGLGLAISKRLVDLMGGDISVESEQGVGSTFTFSIPLKKSEKEFNPFQSATLEDRNVFILDDTDTNLIILKKQCEKVGMKVTTFSDSESFISSIPKLKDFDLGIVDMHMPNKNGIQVAEEIRKMYSKLDLPLVLLSSIMDLKGEEWKALFNLSLTKPIKQTLLFHKLERVFLNQIKKEDSDEKESKKPVKIASDLKILLAEDNPINQKVAGKMLNRFGLSCDVVGNGVEAVQMCKMIAYDLVLMDMEMPEMDGVEATKMIHKIESEIPKLPIIIAMTANAMEEDRKKCLDAGMKDFLPKPVKLSDMQEVLTKWFSTE
ncbi:MAG: response regulator [Balneola sp.]|nr:MAG: response regulator [Balneola sp.]